MRHLRSNRGLLWLVQGLLLLGMCPFGTVQCHANADGAVSIELTVNGVCLTCISQDLACAGCNTCQEASRELAFGCGDECGCLQAPPSEQVAVRSTLPMPGVELLPMANVRPLEPATVLPAKLVVLAAALDHRRSTWLQPVAILRV